MYSDAFLQFKILSLGSLGFGFITSLIFLATVNEKKLTQGFFPLWFQTNFFKDCKEIKKALKSKARADPSEAERIIQLRISDVGINDTQDENTTPLYPAGETLAEQTTGGWNDEEERRRRRSSTQAEEDAVSWTHWFKVPAFYLYGCVYMGVRLLVNVQSVKRYIINSFNKLSSLLLSFTLKLSCRFLVMKIKEVSPRSLLLSQWLFIFLLLSFRPF